MDVKDWMNAELAARRMPRARLAEALGWSPSLAHKKMNGVNGITAEEMVTAMVFFGYPDPTGGGAGPLLERLAAAATRLDAADLIHITALVERLVARSSNR